MVRNRIQYRIATSKLTLPVTIVSMVALWGVLFFCGSAAGYVEIPGYPLSIPLTEWLSGNRAGYLLLLMGHGLVGYLLIECNNAYAVIRTRTTLQTSVYYWLLLASPFLFSPALAVDSVVSLFLGLAVYCLFGSYQRIQPVNQVFYAMLFIGLSSLLFPRMLCLYPVFLLGLYQFRALTLRTFFAGIAGTSLPYWFLFGHACFHGEMDLFCQPFREFSASLGVSHFLRMPVSAWLSSSLAVMLLAVGGIHYKTTSHEDKIRTRSYLDFLLLIGVAIVALGIWQSEYLVVWLQILLPVAALVGGHLFALSRTRLSNWFLVFFLALSGAAMVYGLWTY